MDSETAGRIFEPFYTTKTRSAGTGMGLATVKRIVQQAGGSVGVDTIAGRGTRMTIRLPLIVLREGEIAGLAASETPPRPRPKRSGIRQSHQSDNRGAGL